MEKGGRLGLRAGEWVEVRSVSEILATLDEGQCLEGLPFMPEMLQYCGKRFRVYKSAHKTCDTIRTYHIRRMSGTVHLEGLRCDGQAHGECQAGCLLFWKEAWLKRSTAETSTAAGNSGGIQGRKPAHAPDLSALLKATQAESDGGPVRYRCQATDLLNATTEIKRGDRWKPWFYLKDLTSGNVRLRDFIWYGALATLNSFLLRWTGRRYPHLCGEVRGQTPSLDLNLQPGELIQVRCKDEIMGTLNSQLRNRGLGFDVEMVPYQNGQYRVLRRIEKIINEKTGEMMKLPNPCIVLDGVTCSGNYSNYRMFCPRAIYPYWREIWLKRAEQPADGILMGRQEQNRETAQESGEAVTVNARSR